MTMGTSTVLSYNFTVLLDLKPPKRSQSLVFHPLCQAGISSKHEAGCSFPGNGSLQSLRTSLAARSDKRSKMDFAVCCSPQPAGFPFWPPDNNWTSLIVGLLAILPFLAQRLLTLTKEVDATAETVEKIADAVEKVAEDVEKIAEDVAEKLPEDAKLRKAVNFVENVAKETEKDAQKVEDFMDKVEEVDEEVESLVAKDSKETLKVTNDKK